MVQEFLQDPRTNVNGTDDVGRTGLHLAAREGKEDVVKAILSSDRVDPGIRDKSGRTPFEVAMLGEGVSLDKVDCARLFLKREAAKIESDRAKLNMFVRNSPIDFPDNVLKAELYPWLGCVGQRTISPKLVQRVLDAPESEEEADEVFNANWFPGWADPYDYRDGDGFFSRSTKDDLASDFAEFIKKYGTEEDFPMLDFTETSGAQNS